MDPLFIEDDSTCDRERKNKSSMHLCPVYLINTPFWCFVQKWHPFSEIFGKPRFKTRPAATLVECRVPYNGRYRAGFYDY